MSIYGRLEDGSCEAVHDFDTSVSMRQALIATCSAAKIANLPLADCLPWKESVNLALQTFEVDPKRSAHIYKGLNGLFFVKNCESDVVLYRGKSETNAARIYANIGQ